MDRTLLGATFPGQSEPGSESNVGVLYIPQSSSITGASPSDCLVSYLGYSFAESYPSAEVQSVYSIALANWAILFMTKITIRFIYNEISNHPFFLTIVEYDSKNQFNR